MVVFLSAHFLSFFLSPPHRSFPFFLSCIALSYDCFPIPKAILHILSAPAALLLVLWHTFPFFFLNTLPSLLTSSSVLLTTCSLFTNAVLYKQSCHVCWLSADRLSCEWTQEGKSRKTAMKETLIYTQTTPWLKKILPQNYLFVSMVSLFPSWFFPSLSHGYQRKSGLLPLSLLCPPWDQERIKVIPSSF